MRVLLQIFILLVAASSVLYLLHGRTSHAGRAVKKVGFIFLIIAMVITVFFPHITDVLAKLFGVKDGGSLFVYVLTLSFVLYALNQYLSQQDERDKTLRLARKIALIEAYERYGAASNKSSKAADKTTNIDRSRIF